MSKKKIQKCQEKKIFKNVNKKREDNMQKCQEQKKIYKTVEKKKYSKM